MLHSMSVHTRHLSTHETAALPEGFTRAFNITSVRLIDRAHNPFAKNKILCRGPDLYWQNAPLDFTREPLILQSLLVHELCHVWQYETGRLTALGYLIDPRNWRYSYRVKQNANFDDYPTEKQADLLQDWFLVNSGTAPLRFEPKTEKPTQAWLNHVVPFSWSETRAQHTV